VKKIKNSNGVLLVLSVWKK